jgi:RND family efflux transporter MFP subunit
MPLVRISQNNLLRLILPVPESAVSRVRTGETVDVKVPSMSGKTFPGRVARLSDKVQTATRTMDIEVDVQNPGLTLVPGMYAEVNLHIEQRDNVVAVPLDALEGSGAATHVYAVAQPGVIRMATVKLGLETARKVEILSGLEDGDLVVVGRKAGLKDGDKVQTKMADFLADGTVK